MASRAVEEAIDAHFAAYWAPAHPDVPVYTENNENITPSDGTPFLILQYPVAETSRPPLYTRTYLEEGGFRVVINVERGRGTALIREYGEEIAALFRDVWIGDIQCLVPSEPFTDDDSEEGNYFTGAVVVPYRYTFTP